MRNFNIIAAFAFGHMSVSTASLIPRAIADPVAIYLDKMCYPVHFNFSGVLELGITINHQPSSLYDSPFPCERALYILDLCTANGTAEVDFLAEQQCLCGSSYWELSEGCSACYNAHGYTPVPPAVASSSLSSLSTAECSQTPPYQPYSNLVTPVGFDFESYASSLWERPFLTLNGTDKFPNDTAVSNYFTPTGSVSVGSITGSATARVASSINHSGIRFTPTSTPASSTTGGTSASSTSVASSSSSSSRSSTTASANMAAGMEVKFVGGLLAVGLGVAVML